MVVGRRHLDVGAVLLYHFVPLAAGGYRLLRGLGGFLLAEGREVGLYARGLLVEEVLRRVVEGSDFLILDLHVLAERLHELLHAYLARDVVLHLLLGDAAALHVGEELLARRVAVHHALVGFVYLGGRGLYLARLYLLLELRVDGHVVYHGLADQRDVGGGDVRRAVLLGEARGALFERGAHDLAAVYLGDGIVAHPFALPAAAHVEAVAREARGDEEQYDDYHYHFGVVSQRSKQGKSSSS